MFYKKDKKALLYKRLFSTTLSNKILLLESIYLFSITSQDKIGLTNLCLIT